MTARRNLTPATAYHVSTMLLEGATVPLLARGVGLAPLAPGGRWLAMVDGNWNGNVNVLCLPGVWSESIKTIPTAIKGRLDDC